MAKQVIEMHMYLLTDSNPPAKIVDSFDWRNIGNCMKGRVWLGVQEVEFEFPDIDERQAAIDEISSQVDAVRADSQVAVNALLERISKLQAIGHEVAE